MAKSSSVRACPEIVVKKIEEANLATESKLHEPFSKSFGFFSEVKNDEWGADDSDNGFGTGADTSATLLETADQFNLITDEDVAKKKLQPVKKWGQANLKPKITEPAPSETVEETPPIEEEEKPKKYVPRPLKNALYKKPQAKLDLAEDFVSLNELISSDNNKIKKVSKMTKEKKKNKESVEFEKKTPVPTTENSITIEIFLKQMNVEQINVILDPEKVADKYHNRVKTFLVEC